MLHPAEPAVHRAELKICELESFRGAHSPFRLLPVYRGEEGRSTRKVVPLCDRNNSDAQWDL